MVETVGVNENTKKCEERGERAVVSSNDQVVELMVWLESVDENYRDDKKSVESPYIG